MQSPKLCEPGMIYFLRGSLKECRKFRDNHYTLLFNIVVTLAFFGFIGAFLWYRYKGKPSREEILQKQRKTHSYLISKLQQYSAIKQKKHDSMITDLPVWDKHYA